MGKLGKMTNLLPLWPCTYTSLEQAWNTSLFTMDLSISRILRRPRIWLEALRSGRRQWAGRPPVIPVIVKRPSRTRDRTLVMIQRWMDRKTDGWMDTGDWWMDGRMDAWVARYDMLYYVLITLKYQGHWTKGSMYAPKWYKVSNANSVQKFFDLIETTYYTN